MGLKSYAVGADADLSACADARKTHVAGFLRVRAGGLSAKGPQPSDSIATASDGSRRVRLYQRGATLPLVVLMLTGLLGMAALAIDVSQMGLARERAQSVADAAALAGAASPANASAAAGTLVAANNAVGAGLSGTAVSTDTNNAVTVHGYVNAPLSFAPAVGFKPRGTDGSANTVSVSVSATAMMPSACSIPPGSPVAPFGLIGDDPNNSDPVVAYVSALLSGAKTLAPGAYQAASTQKTLKLNLWNAAGQLVVAGSFDPILISGAGATYQNTIRQTSDQALSAGQTFSTPPLSYDNAGLTQSGISARLAPSNTLFTHASATYNTWYNGHQEQTEGHLMLVPVIRQAAKNKPGTVTVIAFAAFFIDQPYLNPSSNAIVLGRFLGLTIPGTSSGACANIGTVTSPRLTQ